MKDLAVLLLLANSALAQTLVPGLCEPIVDAKLSPLVAGVIAFIDVEEGQAVKSGDVLVRLDDVVEQAEVKRRKLLLDSQDELIAARAQLKTVSGSKEPARRKLIWESTVTLDAAKQQVDTLGRDLEATRKIFTATQSISKEELDAKVLEHALALAQYEERLLGEAREKIEYEMAVAKQESDLALAKAEVSQLETVEKREELEHGISLEQLARKRILSPTDGVVAEIAFEVGEFCEPRTPVIRVVDTRQVDFVAHLEPALAGTLQLEQTVTLRFDGDLSRRASVVFIAPVVDAASGLRKVRARFDNADSAIAPGLAGVLVMD
jgi:multidrug efflux pump subunit AcrA (membrane-fusion protein)